MYSGEGDGEGLFFDFLLLSKLEIFYLEAYYKSFLYKKYYFDINFGITLKLIVEN